MKKTPPKTVKKRTVKKKGVSKGKMVAVGAGVATLSAGAYYLLGPKGKTHQKKLSALTTKMKKEVVSTVKKAQKISAPVYHKAVDAIADTYSREYGEYSKEIKAFAKTLKGELKEAAIKSAKNANSPTPKKKAKR